MLQNLQNKANINDELKKLIISISTIINNININFVINIDTIKDIN